MSVKFIKNIVRIKKKNENEFKQIGAFGFKDEDAEAIRSDISDLETTVGNKANSSEVYNKSTTDSLLNAKQNTLTDADKKEIVKTGTGKFVLIETINTTSDVSRIDRTTEPDGTPYNFVHIIVQVTATTTTVSGNLRVLVNNNNEASTTIRSAFGTLNSAKICRMINVCGILFNTSGGLGLTYSGIANAEITGSTTFVDSINSISLYMGSGTIPSGASIKIYGVRA